MAVTGGIVTPDESDAIGAFTSWLQGMASSWAAANPVKNPANLTALNGMTGASYPDGIVAIVLGASNGLDSGSFWVRENGVWRILAGARVTDLATFTSFIAGNTNVATWASTMFFNVATAEVGVWIDSAGGQRLVLDRAWTDIGLTSGTENQVWGYDPRYKLLAGGTKLRGTIKRSGTSNFANGAILITLPAEARPTADCYFVVPGAGGTLGSIWVKVNGDIALRAAIGGTSSWYSFDNVFIPRD